MARVYVSMTFEDLREYRQKVRLVLQQLGHVDVAMETYVAEPERPLDKCLADVAASDLYIGIFAWRYGYVPRGQDRSITELEYRAAVEHQKDCLIFLLDEDAPWPPKNIDNDNTHIRRLRRELMEEHLCSFFSTSDQLASLVSTAVANWSVRRTEPLSSSQPRIFVSYRHDDTAYPSGWLFDKLEQYFGRDCVFKDIDSIQLGDDFVEVITAAVQKCDVLLAVIGRRWLTITDDEEHRRLDDPNDFVRLEIEAAITRNVRIIPILVDGARMPRADKLPSSLAKLARRQALELSPARFAHDTSQLLRVLDSTLNASLQFSPIALAEAPAAEANRSTEQRERDVAAQRLKGKIETCDYDVFLCHNSKDKEQVITIAERLKERGILPWLDIWEIRPGTRWQKELQKQIKSIKSAAVFIGSKGPGPWQELEVESLLEQIVKRNRPIIPVILEDRQGQPRLPAFLAMWHIVDMRKQDPDPFEQLVWGITGTKSVDD